ncbi:MULTISPECIES: hypothetical protein [Colwellia]|nr:hypothetical protein [Colwellia sp. D2M02]
MINHRQNNCNKNNNNADKKYNVAAIFHLNANVTWQALFQRAEYY